MELGSDRQVRQYPVAYEILRDRDLKQVGRENLADFLREKAHEAIGKTDLSEGKSLLDAECGIRSACAWIKNKFRLSIFRSTTNVPAVFRPKSSSRW